MRMMSRVWLSTKNYLLTRKRNATLWSLSSGEPGVLHHPERGANGCFRTKHQWTERHGRPAGSTRFVAFGVGPAALGAGEQRDHVLSLFGNLAQQRWGFAFVEEVAMAR